MQLIPATSYDGQKVVVCNRHRQKTARGASISSGLFDTKYWRRNLATNISWDRSTRLWRQTPRRSRPPSANSNLIWRVAVPRAYYRLVAG